MFRDGGQLWIVPEPAFEDKWLIVAGARKTLASALAPGLKLPLFVQ